MGYLERLKSIVPVTHSVCVKEVTTHGNTQSAISELSALSQPELYTVDGKAATYDPAAKKCEPLWKTWDRITRRDRP